MKSCTLIVQKFPLRWNNLRIKVGDKNVYPRYRYVGWNMTIPHSGSFSTYISTAYLTYTRSCDASYLVQRAITDWKIGGDMAFFQLWKLLGAREWTQTIIFLKQMNDKLTWAYFYAYTTENYSKVGKIVCYGSKTPGDM